MDVDLDESERLAGADGARGGAPAVSAGGGLTVTLDCTLLGGTALSLVTASRILFERAQAPGSEPGAAPSQCGYAKLVGPTLEAYMLTPRVALGRLTAPWQRAARYLGCGLGRGGALRPGTSLGQVGCHLGDDASIEPVHAVISWCAERHSFEVRRHRCRLGRSRRRDVLRRTPLVVVVVVVVRFEPRAFEPRAWEPTRGARPCIARRPILSRPRAWERSD